MPHSGHSKNYISCINACIVLYHCKGARRCNEYMFTKEPANTAKLSITPIWRPTQKQTANKRYIEIPATLWVMGGGLVGAGRVYGAEAPTLATRLLALPRVEHAANAFGARTTSSPAPPLRGCV